MNFMHLHHNNIKQLSDSKSIFEFIFFLIIHVDGRGNYIILYIGFIYPCWHCQSNNYRDDAVFT